MFQKVSSAIAGIAATSMIGMPAARVVSVRLTMPKPTGRHPVGTASLHLVDHHRLDPWQKDPRPRELMVSVWYPALHANEFPLANHMLPGAAADFSAANPKFSQGVNWATTPTHSREGAPVDQGEGPRPVLLYSPGAGDPRTWATTVVEDLSSRGYIVVTIDHTYDAFGVQFPNSCVANSVFPTLIKQGVPMSELLRKVVDTRVADTRFVLDQLTEIRNGRNPDVDLKPLARGLSGALDMDRIGMFGHSGGGFTAASAMHDDHRIKAGVNLDGLLSYTSEDDGSNLSPVVTDGLNRPFLLIGSEEYGEYQKRPSWKSFWNHSRGWHADVTFAGSRHGSFTDAEALLPQLNIPDKVRADEIGSIDPATSIAGERAYVAAFFDRWLRDLNSQLPPDQSSVIYPPTVSGSTP